MGKSVIGAAGNYIGEVNNVDIEDTTWQITHLHIKLSSKAAKEFGLKKTLKSSYVRIPTAVIKNIGIIITLNQSFVDLKKRIACRL